jgi:hypothetical protein
MHIHLGLFEALRGQDVRESEERGSPQKMIPLANKRQRDPKTSCRRTCQALLQTKKKMYDNKQGGRKEGKYPSQLDIRNNK